MSRLANGLLAASLLLGAGPAAAGLRRGLGPQHPPGRGHRGTLRASAEPSLVQQGDRFGRTSLGGRMVHQAQLLRGREEGRPDRVGRPVALDRSHRRDGPVPLEQHRMPECYPCLGDPAGPGTRLADARPVPPQRQCRVHDHCPLTRPVHEPSTDRQPALSLAAAYRILSHYQRYGSHQVAVAPRLPALRTRRTSRKPPSDFMERCRFTLSWLGQTTPLPCPSA